MEVGILVVYIWVVNKVSSLQSLDLDFIALQVGKQHEDEGF